MEELNLKELFSYFLSKFKIIIIVTILVVALGTVYSYFLKTPMYKSSTTLVLVRTADSDEATITQNDVLLNQKLVATYREIVKSPRVLNKVIQNLELKSTSEELQNIVTVESIADTELIKISVVHEDAKEAKEIANEVAEVFAEEIVDIYQIQNISTLNKAEMKKDPYNINIVKEEIIYVLAGIILSCGIIFVMYYFDTTIKTVEEVEAKFELPILGQIPMRKGQKKGGKK